MWCRCPVCHTIHVQRLVSRQAATMKTGAVHIGRMREIMEDFPPLGPSIHWPGPVLLQDLRVWYVGRLHGHPRPS